jgi:hypothetical protein
MIKNRIEEIGRFDCRIPVPAAKGGLSQYHNIRFLNLRSQKRQYPQMLEIEVQQKERKIARKAKMAR